MLNDKSTSLNYNGDAFELISCSKCNILSSCQVKCIGKTKLEENKTTPTQNY